MAEPFHFVVDSSGRLDTFLSSQLGKSRASIQDQIKEGHVSVNGKTALKASITLKAGDTVTGSFLAEPAPLLAPIPFQLDILFEDEYLLAINKPQGLIVHPSPGHSENTLVHYLLHHLGLSPESIEPSDVRPGIVHRLDRGTSGIILVAKNREIQEALSSQFASRTIRKEYEAIAWGKMKPEGRINTPLGRDKSHRKKMSSKTTKARTAETAWKVIHTYEHFTHVAIFPKTGRTHQIRVHLTEGGNAIVGDPLYGKGSTEKRLKLLSPEVSEFLRSVTMTFLHARKIEFTHPKTQENITLSCEPPPPFKAFLELLGK